MRVRFSPIARGALDEIFAYIAVDNPIAAADLVAHIEQVALLIGHFPEMGKRTKRRDVRTFPVGNYILVYEITHDEVVIHYARHTARQ